MHAHASLSRPSESELDDDMRLPTEANEDLNGAEFSVDDDTRALLEDISHSGCADPALGGRGVYDYKNNHQGSPLYSNKASYGEQLRQKTLHEYR